MKTKQISSKLFLTALIVLISGATSAAEKQALSWNEVAKSQAMNADKLGKLKEVFPSWKIKQVTWPAASEIKAKKTVVDPNLINESLSWLSKFIDSEYLPKGLDKKLIAMKGWGAITKESEQKRLCDVFIARFKKDSTVIQIQESPYNVVLSYCDERVIDSPAANHKDFVIDVASHLLNDKIRPKSNSENLVVYEPEKDGQKITRVIWTIDSLVTRRKEWKEGVGAVSMSKASVIGTTGGIAETNGVFIRFEILKCVKGPRPHLDPYTERFGTPK